MILKKQNILQALIHADAKKDFVALKAEFDKLEISKQTNVPTSLNNLKNKVHGLDVCKLKTVPVDLKT